MEFLVEKITDIPETLNAEEAATVRARESAVIAEMLDSGALRRLWRSRDNSRVITIGLWEAEGEGELNQLLNRPPCGRGCACVSAP
jgi:muconolactone delta-isomerase